MSVEIHPTAIVSPGAEMEEGTRIGPYAVVGDEVRLGPGCEVMAHAVLEGPMSAGPGCRFHPFASVGSAPQDLKFRGERTEVVIGAENVFREFVTVNRGTSGGGGTTRIGDGSLFMAYTHVAHDCSVGSRTVFGNAATLAGHVTVEDDANIGAFSGVHQHCRVGRHAFIGGYSVITQDALPYIKSVGYRNQAASYGVNAIGLERKGFSAEAVESLKSAYRLLKKSGLNTTQALERIEMEIKGSAEVDYLVAFIRDSPRGVIK